MDALVSCNIGVSKCAPMLFDKADVFWHWLHQQQLETHDVNIVTSLLTVGGRVEALLCSAHPLKINWSGMQPSGPQGIIHTVAKAFENVVFI